MEFDFKRMALVLAATLLVLFGTLNTALAWTLSGTVYGGSSRLANATVKLSSAATASVIGTTSTNASGDYSFTGLDGSYNLTITPPAASGFSESVVNGIPVSGGDITQNVVLVQQAVQLSGVVKTSGGVLLDGVYVTLYDQVNGSQIGDNFYTSTNGQYSFNVARGTYKIRVSSNGSSTVKTPSYWYINPVVSNLSVTGNTTQDLVVPFVTLSGKTTDSNEVAVSGVETRLSKSWNLNGISYSVQYYGGRSVSDASGNYTMNLLPYTYDVTTFPPSSSGLAQTLITGVAVAGNMTRDFASTAAAPTVTVTLSGVVKTSGGVLLDKVYVTLYDQVSGSQIGNSFYTSTDGQYSINAAPGTYKIRVYSYGSSTVKTPSFWDINPIVSNLSVAGNTTQDLVIPFVTLSGKTTDSNGVAVSGVETRVSKSWYLNGISYSVRYYGGRSVSDASGNYTMNLLPYTYDVTTFPPSSSGLAQTLITGVAVAGNMTRDFASTAAVTLSGVVKTSGGVLLDRVYVALYDQVSGSQIGNSFYTSTDGQYSINAAPGTYKIRVYSYGSSTVKTPSFWDINPIVSNLSVAGNTTQDLVIPFVTLSGKTTDSNGVAVSGVETRVSKSWYLNGISYSVQYDGGRSVSDASGTYTMYLLPYMYDETIVPPTQSGFAQTQINGIDVTHGILQNIILSLPDTTAPVILSGPTASSITDTTATVEWQTNEPAKGGVVYGIADPPGTTVAESVFTSSHSSQLAGLTPNTKYYVKVTASDAVSNGPTTSSVISFTTAPTPDKTPPVILTGPTVSSITHVSAVVEWTTDEPTTGSVVYGLSNLPDTSVADATLSTTHRVTLSGLTPETRYYLKVTAIDSAQNGPVSTSVTDFPTLAAPDTTAPVITASPMSINITATGATIEWETDEPATSGVSYDDGTVNGLLSDDTLTTSHSMTITGLSASKAYNFTVSSKDAFNNGPTLSDKKTFTTPNAVPDTNPPVLTQLPIIKVTTHQSAVLYWETDEPASSTIAYGTTVSFGLTDAKSELNTKHNRVLTGLLPGTTYYFRVQATDVLQNSDTSKTYSFTTELNPDTKPPVITQEAAIVYSNDKAATVAFTTDKPCDTVVNYGPNGSNGFQKSSSEKVNDHQLALTNLTPNTSYNVQVSCTDISGNTVTASAGTPSTMMAMDYSFILSDAFVGASGVGFITKSQPDTTAPAITTTPRAIAVTSNMVRIHWNTDEIADSQVFYGLVGQSLSNSTGAIGKSAGHSVALTNLTPNTAYEFKVKSTDPSNNSVTSGVYSFTTAAVPDTTPPVISSISAAGATSSQINVSWMSDEESITVLKYGTTPFTLTGQVSIAGSRTAHTLSLYNLVPGTTYYLAPVSTDGSGNSIQGATQSVVLSGVAPVSYTITATAGAGGSITPASQSVFSGYKLALAVKPNTGYLIQGVTGCGGTLSGSVYTTAEVTGNCAVSAFFQRDPNSVVLDLISTAYPAGGSYSGGTLLVKLTANRQGATIYYTTDGTAPSVSSAIYSAPIPVTGTKTVKFFAKDGTSTEATKSVTYTAAATGQPSASFAGLKQGTNFTVSRSEAGRSASTIYSGSQTNFIDTGSLKPNTIYSYTVASDVEGGTEILTIHTPLYSGWNIVAVPYDMTGVSPSSAFGVPVTVYQWIPTGATTESSNSVLGSYNTVSALAPGYGYFIKAGNNSTLLSYSGNPGPVSTTVTLKPGWTMIANTHTSNKTDIASNWLIDGGTLSAAILANKIGGGIYWWNGTTYESWSILGGNPQIEPWKGYWILNLDPVNNHVLTIE